MNASLAGVLVAAGRPRTAPAPATLEISADDVDIVIIGAGIGGLALSRALLARGVSHVVLEAADRPGGAIRTIERAGSVLELGPQRSRLTPAFRELVRELGIEDELIVAPADLPLFIHRAGRLRQVPLSAAQLLRTDLLSTRAKLRLLAEPLTATGDRRGAKAPHSGEPAADDETVADYFTRRFGHEAYEHLLGPLFGGLYASDPRDMLVRHALRPALRELGADRSAVLALLRRGFRQARAPAACSFRRGMQTLTDAMLDSVRDHVRLASPVLALEKTGSRFDVVTDDGLIAASHIVLTCPAHEAARLLERVASPAAERLRQLVYNRIALVHMLSNCGIEAMGYQVSFAEPLHTRGVTFNHALFARDRVHTAFLGGAREPSLVDRSDEEIATVACDEFHQVTACDAKVTNISRATIPAWDRSWTAIDGLTLPAGIHLCANYESRIGIPGRLARAHRLAATLGREDAQ